MSRERVRNSVRPFIRSGEWDRDESRKVGPRNHAAKPGTEDFNYRGIFIPRERVAAKRNREGERTKIRNPYRLP